MSKFMISEAHYNACTLCPRCCHADRRKTVGYCRSGSQIKVARAALHHWEEPCISGTNGSGAIFFSGCTLGCCYCQNYSISREGFGKEISEKKLADIFLQLQEQGAHNLNLITSTQYLPSVLKALDLVKHKLAIPVIYNCGGYERVETVKALKNYIDIWLPDLKYWDSRLSARYSQAPDYFSCASQAIQQMICQTGPPVLDDKSLMKSGVIIRHMVLPGLKEDSIRLLHWIKEVLPLSHYYLSLLSQYTPFYKARKGGTFPEISRRITTYEYEKVVNAAIDLGLTQGYMQEKSSAKEEYTPPFDLEGV
jgi:putative pyruvate formate lyase activating enzyme